METTFSRKKRSSRNWPSATACSRSLVGGGDDPDVDANVVLAAEARELAVLQHLQQLRLQRKAHVADLVEEHRAVVGELELAGLVLDRAGERAALEAEQLRLEQLGRAARRSSLSRTACRGGATRHAERARDELFAGAALSANEHRRRRCRRRARSGPALRPSARTVPEQHRVCRLRLQLLAQRRRPRGVS